MPEVIPAPILAAAILRAFVQALRNAAPLTPDATPENLRFHSAVIDAAEEMIPALVLKTMERLVSQHPRRPD